MGKVTGRSRSPTRSFKAQKTCSYWIKKEIKKNKKTSKGLKCSKILELTECQPRFIGCFAESKIHTLKIMVKPVFFMVHVGIQNGHWIAVGIFSDKIEIFDPLGFEIFKWPEIPCSFLTFLHIHSQNKRLLISGRVQPSNSHLCGFYCLLYIIKRPKMSFLKIQSLFSTYRNNDLLLPKLF